MSKTVAFTTLGCKVNQYDTQAMLEQFQAHGYAVVSDRDNADVYVINTCTVTGTGDQKSMQLIRRSQRRNPEADVVITGCMAQRMGETLRQTGARLILGTQRRLEVVTLLEKAIAQDMQIVAVDSLSNAPFEPLRIAHHDGHTRAVMKIQEGCDNHCTYCIIPSVRGKIRSRTLDEIAIEAKALALAGFCEIVVTGIHLTSYGRDLENKPTLAQAVEVICQQEGIKRVRLGSLEPSIASDAFIQTIRQYDAVCPQFHLALQSGSDAVLAKMKRRYNTSQFLDAVKRLRKAYPQCAITTDLIVGFPGETDEAFDQSMRFLKEISFAKVHVFPYSKREGTPAAIMPDQVREAIKQSRVKTAMAIADLTATAYHQSLLGQTCKVLLEEENRQGYNHGYNAEYVSITVEGGTLGQIQNVRLTEVTKAGMHGVIVE